MTEWDKTGGGMLTEKHLIAPPYVLEWNAYDNYDNNTVSSIYLEWGVSFIIQFLVVATIALDYR